jgi:hypothetical protein
VQAEFPVAAGQVYNLKWGNYLKNLLNREENLAGIERVWQGYFAENGRE